MLTHYSIYPQRNPSKNLLQAIELYREVLNYRREVKDEIGYARTLANMGNALAHLGKLSEAKRTSCGGL
jgi:hypothetical protein